MLWRAYSVAVAERARAEAEKKRSDAHLQVALQAVDDMYTRIASEWLSSDAAISNTQADFLNKALVIYETIARQPDEEGRPKRGNCCRLAPDRQDQGTVV